MPPMLAAGTLAIAIAIHCAREAWLTTGDSIARTVSPA